MKIDCSKAGSKYKYLQKRKAEADGKYVTAERELGDQREEKDKKYVNWHPVQCIRLDTA